MEYFDLDGLKNYQRVSRTTYKGGSPASHWFYDARDKLKYLIKLLSEKTGNEYKLVYTEKPNGQAGQGIINFKDYVLAGFSITSEFGDDLFMKVSISNIKESPVFDLNIDMNFKKKSSYFQDRRNHIFNNSYIEWDIDNDFPTNWDGLVELIIEPFETLEIAFKKYLSEIQNSGMDNSQNLNSIINLLKYKKQIILQGPPGTGKTRLAKKIARELLIEDLKKSFTEVDLLAIVKEKTTVNTFTNYNSFEIIKVDVNSFKIYPKGAKLEYKVFFSDVIDCIKDFDANDLVKKYDKKGVGTYLVGIAKYVVDSLETVRQQIIQFHPSYTYDDFVRGITVKPNPDGEGVLYEAQNKILGAFADEAFQNYKLSREQVSISVSDVELFDLFINDIKEKIADSDEQRFSLTDSVYLFEPDEKRFKYKGDNWIAHSKGLNMKFSELQKIIAANITERAQVKQLDGVEELTKQHATYFIKVVEMFYKFKSNHSSNQTNKEIKTTLKNYVLIIDEINRANLSSVLGELIYALEYRGESVDSMYAIDGNNKLTLPPNLFIIGTMNTADRSVGHIDYAIRRRFAFVDVLPKNLEDAEIVFHAVLFKQVAGLFIKNYDSYVLDNATPLENEREYLSEEFEAKDVWLGHSYFIQKEVKDTETLEPENFNIRVKYEIVPILREYVKDGILNDKATEIINEIEKSYSVN